MSFSDFLSELKKILESDKEIINKIILFTVVLGIFELTVPFSVQMIINRLYKTYNLEPIVSILFISLFCLIILSFILFIRFNLIEVIHKSIFAKISNNIGHYLAEKNDIAYSLKFFEILNLKKFIAKFLADGISLLLSLILGFLILFFYHPFFAALALFVVISFVILLKIFHKRTSEASIIESKAKYDVAREVTNSMIKKEIKEDDIKHLTSTYLIKRHLHFRYLQIHYFFILLIFIVSHIILLGGGSALVLNGELTVGQLVASELIFSTILVGIAKSIDYIETYYDTLAGLEKISFIDNYKIPSSKQLFIPSYKKRYFLTKITLIIFPLLLLLTPWVQTAEGIGTLTTLKPDERVQDISALVKGRIGKWFVSEGQAVNKGDPIVEIVDNDPNYSKRLKVDRDAAFKKYQAAKMAAETALYDFERQNELYTQGLTSRLKFEKAKINYHKLLASEAESASSLAKTEVNFARQQRQVITAPSNGTIQQLYSGNSSSLIKAGTKLAVFVPESTSPAVELYVDGNDIPLIHKGRKVRLEFEGFPALQFSGWPNINFGTFEGEVVSLDSTASANGKFRVMITPTDPDAWPGAGILRRGSKVKGWILMNTVKVGYEFWRQFNGFPPLPDEFAISASKEKK